jgi:hypothetical protein
LLIDSRPLIAFLEIVLEDLAVVEGDVFWEVHLVIKPDLGRIGAGAGFPSSSSDPNERRRVSTIVATGVGIDVKLPNEFDVESRLLFGFSKSGFFNSFAHIDKATGESPSCGRVLALDEHDEAGTCLDNNIGGQAGGLGGALILCGHLLTGVHLVIIS